MGYYLNPAAALWSEGAVCLPKEVCEKQLRFADENKLKVLLLLAAKGKACSEADLAEALKLDATEIKDCLDYWTGEGITLNAEEAPQPATEQEAPVQPAYESLPMPNLTSRDITNICSENEELAGLLRTAEKVLMSTISIAMKSNLINMVTYYGLPVPVVVTLLNYYKSEYDAGKNVTTRTLNNLAKEWANEGVTTLEEASQKLEERVSCSELWGEVIALCEFDYKKPSPAQLKMVARWRGDFDKEMIFFACNTMKKYNDKETQSLKIVDNILKEWKRKGFKTPRDVKSRPKKENKKDGRLKGKPSFDIDEIKQKANINNDFDI